MKKGGKLVLTAPFTTNEQGHKMSCDLLPPVKENVDRMPPIGFVRNAFKQAGFKEVKYYMIGENVFVGSNKWFDEVNDVAWSRNFYKAYLLGYIDYYVIVLEKL